LSDFGNNKVYEQGVFILVLEVNNLQKSFATGFLGTKVSVLRGVSFNVREGAVVGFIGANGAGKSTTIKSILGLIKPDSGEISYFGQKKFNPDLFKKIGFLPERPNFYKFLTGKEFLSYYGRLSNKLSGAKLKEQIDIVLKKVHLFEDKDKLIKSYSKGMVQRIGIAQALIHDPQFIILDEPLSGLDPDGRYQLTQIIKQAANDGKTIFFSSHLLDDTERLCDDIVVIKKGLITFQGSIDEVLSQTKSSYTISFSNAGKRSSLVVEDEETLNKEISNLVAKKINITDVSRKNKSLEEAYVAMVSDENV